MQQGEPRRGTESAQHGDSLAELSDHGWGTVSRTLYLLVQRKEEEEKGEADQGRRGTQKELRRARL